MLELRGADDPTRSDVVLLFLSDMSYNCHRAETLANVQPAELGPFLRFQLLHGLRLSGLLRRCIQSGAHCRSGSRVSGARGHLIPARSAVNLVAVQNRKLAALRRARLRGRGRHGRCRPVWQPVTRRRRRSQLRQSNIMLAFRQIDSAFGIAWLRLLLQQSLLAVRSFDSGIVGASLCRVYSGH